MGRTFSSNLIWSRYKNETKKGLYRKRSSLNSNENSRQVK